MTRLSWRYGPEARSWALVSAVLALCALLLPPAPAARADTPLDLEAAGRVTDTVGALARRRVQVDAAIDRLRTTHHVQLYVTYVHDFSGRTGRTWADATADRNGLGPHDILLAVATNPRRFAVSADAESGFRKDQLALVEGTAIAPAVQAHDWAGAAIGAADGYAAVLSGEPVRPPVIRPGRSDPGGDGLVPGRRSTWLPVAGGAAACLGALYLCTRRGRAARRRRAGVTRDRPVLATTTEPGLARLAQPLTPLPDLEEEAARDLVGTDDAVHTSTEEILFATAQLGERATRRFAEAVAYARDELAVAFRLRQRLDETAYEDEDVRRHALDEICSRCTSANRRLDAESEAFDRLRGLKVNAALILDGAETVARALEPRVSAAEAVLTALAQCRAGPALEPVATHPAEARDRLAVAEAALAEARSALLVGSPRRAALSLRTAEAALSQAHVLAGAVLRHTHGLTAGPAPGPAARAVRAARGEVAAARDYIATHRGAVGCRARTLLAEARHLLAAATEATALTAAPRARDLARTARSLAEDDVAAYAPPVLPYPTLRGALLGGVVLATELLPPTFGGVGTRGRLGD
ncbi:TPM domain-containing protein [Streptomyces sp. NPDC053048]|uniref:TPM domain-containing protein n=1 Tax=Streptomyces sp. NPDC053048 TaxID=3365694 RepID=UPI0037D5F0D5